MALTKLTTDLNIIAALDDEPNDVGGLSAAQLKAEFDEAGNTVKAYVNETLTVELDNNFATKAEVQSVVLGQIPDGSLTKTKMATAVQDSLNKADSALQSLPLHTHGNITNDGKVGSTAGLALFTGTNGTVEAKTAAVALGLLGALKIATGSYTGTGVFGSANKNSIPLSFTPKVIIVISGNNADVPFIMINPATAIYYHSVEITGGKLNTVAWGATTTWYNAADAIYQLNSNGITYTYVALG